LAVRERVMCPACLEALALLIVGATSSGGVAALIVNKFRAESKEGAKDSLKDPNPKEESWQK
jgi:hypothetical protein